MAQPTLNTRLAAAHETRQQLEDEIACLRAEVARRPTVENHSNSHSPSPTDMNTAILEDQIFPSKRDVQ